MSDGDLWAAIQALAGLIWTLLMTLPDVWGHRRILYMVARDSGHPYLVLVGLYGTIASSLWGVVETARLLT